MIVDVEDGLRRGEGDFDAILADSDLIVELIGGLDPARDYVLRAMAAGKHVVTANKALLAQNGMALAQMAEGAGVSRADDIRQQHHQRRAGIEVDNTQPPVTKKYACLEMIALGVGAAMRQSLKRGSANSWSQHSRVSPNPSGQSTHQAPASNSAYSA